MRYDTHRGFISDFNYWKLSTIVFMLLSIVTVLIALHCAKPIHCDEEVYNPDHTTTCEIIER